jgi:excisionase family DNA binding protein
MVTSSQLVELINKDANRVVGPVVSAGTLPFTQDPPEWLRVPEAVRRFGLGRSTIYELIRNREIKTALIRKRGNTRGRRIISTDSLRAYVERFVEGPCK